MDLWELIEWYYMQRNVLVGEVKFRLVKYFQNSQMISLLMANFLL